MRVMAAFGFVQVEGESRMRFMHPGSISEDSPAPFHQLKQHDIVEFEPEATLRGPRVKDGTLRVLP